jgi:protein SCO1/2
MKTAALGSPDKERIYMKKSSLVVLAALYLAFAVTAVHGQDTKTAPKAPPQPQGAHSTHQTQDAQSAAQKYFSHLQLDDQDGKTRRFYSDVLKGKTVVINVFFATCTGVCPPMNRNMEKIQEGLRDRVGKDIFLVSITVDPVNDTPARLREYAQRFNARAGWIFLTGKKENVDWALYKLGNYVESREDHRTIIIIGNEATGLWKKGFGLAKPEELLKLVQETADDKGAAK